MASTILSVGPDALELAELVITVKRFSFLRLSFETSSESAGIFSGGKIGTILIEDLARSVGSLETKHHVIGRRIALTIVDKKLRINEEVITSSFPIYLVRDDLGDIRRVAVKQVKA